MKLFLASSIDKTLPLLEEKIPNIGKRVLFIVNASDPSSNPFWIDWDRNKFKELGYQLSDLDLRKTTPEDLRQALQSNDILHVCGGSVFYLLSLIREKHFDNIIRQAIIGGSVIYTGTSAGSIIVSDNIKAFSYDEEERDFINKVPDNKGLGIINFGIMPHSNNPDFLSENKKVIDKMASDPTAIFYIQDHQAVWVQDGRIELLESK